MFTKYVNTHESVLDGSPAMGLAIFGDLMILVNEDGYSWSDPAEHWRAI